MADQRLKPSKPSEVREPLSARYTEAEKKKLKELALEWTDGNVSEWIRISSLRFKPRKEDIV